MAFGHDGLDTALARRLHEVGAVDLPTLQASLAQVRARRRRQPGLTLAVHLVERGLIDGPTLESAWSEDLARRALAGSGGGPPAPPPVVRLAPGAVLGRHRVLRPLGEGGMGAVFEVEHLDTGARRALKAVPPGLDPKELARFRREAQALARLDHPHVVRVHEAALDGPQPWLVEDLAPGGSLQERLEREGPLPLREAAALARKVGLALAHCHARGVLHRDLKPHNVLLDERGEPRLADFGLARGLDTGSLRLTATGHFVGTPAYMAPEQATGDRGAGVPADVYALGAVLFALLTGGPPFDGDMWATISQVLRKPAPAPSARRPEVDPALDAICLACLAKRPEDRPASALAVVAALDAWLAEGAGAPVGQALAAGGGRPRRARALAAALAATLALAAALAAAAAGPSPPPEPPPRPRPEPLAAGAGGAQDDRARPTWAHERRLAGPGALADEALAAEGWLAAVGTTGVRLRGTAAHRVTLALPLDLRGGPLEVEAALEVRRLDPGASLDLVLDLGQGEPVGLRLVTREDPADPQVRALEGVEAVTGLLAAPAGGATGALAPAWGAPAVAGWLGGAERAAAATRWRLILATTDDQQGLVGRVVDPEGAAHEVRLRDGRLPGGPVRVLVGLTAFGRTESEAAWRAHVDATLEALTVRSARTTAAAPPRELDLAGRLWRANAEIARGALDPARALLGEVQVGPDSGLAAWATLTTAIVEARRGRADEATNAARWLFDTMASAWEPRLGASIGHMSEVERAAVARAWRAWTEAREGRALDEQALLARARELPAIGRAGTVILLATLLPPGRRAELAVPLGTALATRGAPEEALALLRPVEEASPGATFGQAGLAALRLRRWGQAASLWSDAALATIEPPHRAGVERLRVRARRLAAAAPRGP